MNQETGSPHTVLKPCCASLFKISLFFLLFAAWPAMGRKYYNLIWSDEFNGNGMIDTAAWNFEYGVPNNNNGEYQNYTDRLENVRQEGGNLVIEARKDNFEGTQYSSARINTHGKKEFQYVRFEARARATRGQGMWPAIWMMPPTIFKGTPWPECGEFDVLEHIGRDPQTNYSRVHTGAYNHINGNQVGGDINIPDMESAFHVYAVDWTPTRMEFSVDDQVFLTYDKQNWFGHSEWPLDEPYFVIINVAVGGSWGGAPDGNTPFPNAMLVDYLRVYEISDVPFPPAAPVITDQPKDMSAEEGRSVTFSVGAEGEQLSYIWKVNGAVQAGENGASLTLEGLTPADSGAEISVMVYNDADTVLSESAVLIVLPHVTEMDGRGMATRRFLLNAVLRPGVLSVIMSEQAPTTLTLVSSEGGTVLNQSYQGGSASFMTGQLSNGVYLLQAISGNAVERVKLIHLR